jgi:hypothetical protein
MLARFKLDGRVYSKNKEAFKTLLKKHGIYWKGTFVEPWWGSDSEKVTALFERDQVRDITIAAVLTWEGETESPFLKEFKTWCYGLKAQELSVKASDMKRSVDDIMFYDMVYKPQAAYLESSGRPKSWIEKDMQRFETERTKKFGGKTPI